MHQPDAGSGVLAAAADSAGVVLEEWLVPELPAPSLDGVNGLVILGGSADVAQSGTLPWMADELDLITRALRSGLPALGLCLGAQLITHAAGGRVFDLDVAEIGWRDVELTAAAADDPLLGGLESPQAVFQWHHCAFSAPPGATILAANAVGSQAFALERAWGLQFHPEVTETIVNGWITDDGEGEEARAAGVAADALRTETATAIAGSMRLGAELLRRFAAVAAGVSAR